MGVTTPRQAIYEIRRGGRKPKHALEFLTKAEAMLEKANLADIPMTASNIDAVLKECGYLIMGKQISGILR